MRAVLVMAGLSVLASCQLAEDPDRPKCAEGYHPDLRGCARDETTKTRVTIAGAEGGTLCTGDPAVQRPPVLTPETITVKVNEEFQFENEDSVQHEIRGTDGTVWLTVPAGQMSPFSSIVKAGTFAYRVSGCAKGGTVIVE